MARVLVAQTHSSEYLIHKYWSRKPANVVRALIERQIAGFLHQYLDQGISPTRFQ